MSVWGTSIKNSVRGNRGPRWGANKKRKTITPFHSKKSVAQWGKNEDGANTLRHTQGSGMLLWSGGSLRGPSGVQKNGGEGKKLCVGMGGKLTKRKNGRSLRRLHES